MRFGGIFAAALLLLLALVPGVWMWPPRGEVRRLARARRTAAWAVAAAGFTELGLEIILLLGFQALYGYVYHELTILVAMFMAGAALGAAFARRRERNPDGDGRREWWWLAALQLALAAAPLLLFALLVQLGRVASVGGGRASSDLLFPALALAAGALGGAQFLLASRIYFGSAESAAPHATPSPGALYALDLVGACVGALALSILLIPIYGFLRTAVLMAAVNLFPAAMAAACARATHA